MPGRALRRRKERENGPDKRGQKPPNARKGIKTTFPGVLAAFFLGQKPPNARKGIKTDLTYHD